MDKVLIQIIKKELKKNNLTLVISLLENEEFILCLMALSIEIKSLVEDIREYDIEGLLIFCKSS